MQIELSAAERQELIFFLQQGLNQLGDKANVLGAKLNVPEPAPAAEPAGET